ncbi:Mini-ribonuclease 3 [Spirulina subsalsa]|uniref:Mini-ribonuclease 3 n=1 Tax=Spirulina subsalsa TaxID=54311 RepID=UPI00036E0854|nr:ribonuclease III domain-containing protein [Spirulina subsalsa]
MIQPSPSSQSDPSSWLAEPWGGVGALTSSLKGQPVERLSPLALAYLGDAIYELYIRQYYLFPPRRIAQYHQLVVSQVRAERQAAQLQLLLPQLTQEELTIVRRGRNATHRRPSRLAPAIYQQATSLEALVGYLYLTNPQRLHDLLVQLPLD